jgi:hypothetical protein
MNGTSDLGSSFDYQEPAIASDCPSVVTFPFAMDNTGDGTIPWTSNYNSATDLGAFVQPNLSALGVNWMSPQYQDDVNWEAILAGFTASHDGTPRNVQSPMAVQGATGPENDLDQQPSRGLQPVPDFVATQSCDVTVSAETSLSTTNIYYVDGTGARAPFRGRSRGRSLVVNGQELGEAELDVVISPLSDIPSIEVDLCPPAAYGNLLHHVLSEQQNHGVDHNIVTFPSRTYINLCVRHYFGRFHPIFPFVRKSSFVDVASSEWLLLLAVAATGSRYIRRQPGRSSEDMLTTTLDTALQCRRYGYGTGDSHGCGDDLFTPGLHTRPAAFPSIPMLQAGILNIILLQHSGKRILVERALVERHYLVQACDSLELISQDTQISYMKNTLDLELVQEWIVRESEIRVGMMIWVIDQPLSCTEVSLTFVVPRLHFPLRVQGKTFDGTR